MSTTYQLPQRSKVALLSYAIAVLIALSIGAAAASLVTRAVVQRPQPVAAASGWDVQRLRAMEGRQLVASVRRARVRPWDAAKLAAMAGRQEAEAIRLGGSPR